MPERGLEVELSLPWRCLRLDLSAHARNQHWQHSLMLLRVVNLMQPQLAHEGNTEAVLARLEAKLDLALNLLARVIGGEDTLPVADKITLSPEGCRLPQCDCRQAAESCLLKLYPEPSLALALDLPARVIELGEASALRWIEMPEAMREQWEQWLFRQHRRAVQLQRRPS